MTAPSAAPPEPAPPELSRGPRRRPRTLSALALAGALLLVFVARRAGPPPDPPTLPGEDPAVETKASEPPFHLVPAARGLGDALAADDGSVEEDLQTLDQLLYLYRQAFGGNPEGGNEDLVDAFLGGNPGRAAFLPPDSPALVDGKLVDRWGTPYWFHALSGSEMEIRSAGPDRELFTDDDLVLP